MYATAVLMTLVAAVAAVPYDHHPDVHVEKEQNVKTVQEVGDVCGNGNEVHCCNSESASKAVGGLLGLNLENVLSGCQKLDIPIIAANVPITDYCQQTAICCGEQEQNVSLSRP